VARIRVGVLMGGASSEREISLASGKMIAEHLPRDRYDVVMLDSLALMAGNPKLPKALREQAQALVEHRRVGESLGERDRSLPSAFQDEIRQAADATLPAGEALAPTRGGARIDVAFLALHGPYGEDGTIQGLLELIAEGVPVPRGVTLERADWREDAAAALQAARALLPGVVKPARQGSSIGMSLPDDAAALEGALQEAFRFDSRVLVEERLRGTEITVGVIGNRELRALPVVEIVPKHAFFDYQAKYDPSLSEEICPARIPEATARAAQELACRSHRALDCRGLSRTDMILTAAGPVVLELNTMPGMTVNSLLPKAARAAGIPFGELLHRLVELALEPEP
jgi:D-alanine-D-alanine ligase